MDWQAYSEVVALRTAEWAKKAHGQSWTCHEEQELSLLLEVLLEVFSAEIGT